MTSAEQAYLFRHALLRDAAYELQMPSERGRLHALAFDVLEAIHGVPSLDSREQPHPSDAASADLARHAGAARFAAAGDTKHLRSREALYLRRAAMHAIREYRQYDELAAWVALSGVVSGAERAVALAAAAQAALEVAGGSQQASRLADEAVTLARQTSSREAAGKALRVRAHLHRRNGRMNQAENELKGALAEFEAAQLSRECAVAWNELATARKESGHTGDAEVYYERALGLAVQHNYAELVGVIMANQATLYAQTGRPREAQQTGRDALARLRQAGLRAHEGIALSNLATELRLDGQMDDAMALYREAMAIHRETGNLRSQGIALLNMAHLEHSHGNHEDAASLLRDALVLFRDLGEQRLEATTLSELALAEVESGNSEQALNHAREAVLALAALGHVRAAAIARCHLACVLTAAKQTLAAQQEWTAGITRLLELGDTTEVQQLQAEMQRRCERVGTPSLHTPSPC